MFTTQRDWRFAVSFGYKLQRRFAFRGAGANDFVCLRKLRRRNNRRLRLDDSSFLVRNLLQGITEPLFVIESDRRNHSDIRLNGIGCVESAAQTRFQNDDVDLRFGEMFQREHSRDFEKGWMRFPISDELPNTRQAS